MYRSLPIKLIVQVSISFLFDFYKGNFAQGSFPIFCVIFPQRKRKKLLQTRLILPMGKAGTRFHRLFEGGAPGMVRPQRCFHHIQHRYPPGLPLQDRFSQGYPWRLSWVMSLQMPSLIGSYPGRFGPMLGFGEGRRRA